MFKLDDFKCKDCGHTTEILIDSKDPDQKLECEKCKSQNLEKVLSVSTGKVSHSTWSKWRV